MTLGKVPILLFHDLDSENFSNKKITAAAADTVVSSDIFSQLLEQLAAWGYVSLSLKDFFEFRAKNQPFADKSIILTFDDGHYSNYHLAYPLLKKFGFSATFFIIADQINKKFFLEEPQIREMFDAGMEIGSHGLSHEFFPLFERNEMVYELTESKTRLENIIKDSVSFFAYPGGHFDKRVLASLPICGYTGACSCLQGFNGKTTHPYLLRRLEIRRRFRTNELVNLFDPKSVAFHRLIDVWKSALKRTVGLRNYVLLRRKLYKFYPFRR